MFVFSAAVPCRQVAKPPATRSSGPPNRSFEEAALHTETPTTPRGGDNSGEKPLFKPRTVLLMLLSLCLGFLIGYLTFAAWHNTPSAIIAGITTAGAVLYIGNKMIDDD